MKKKWGIWINMKIGITGHRPLRLKGQEKEVEYWIEQQLKNFKACYKDITLITGMAMGVDQIAALVAIKLGIPVECLFGYQHKLSDLEQYIVDNAESVRYYSKTYTNKSLFLERDKKLVDESDILLVVWDGKNTGGTYYTYQYAKEKQKNIFVYPWKITTGGY